MRIARNLHQALTTFKPRLICMGLAWAWIYCCWFSSPIFEDGAGSIQHVSTSISFLMFALGIAGTLFLTPPLAHKQELHKSMTFKICAVCFMMAGTFFHASPAVIGQWPAALSEITSFFSGIGCAWLWIMWSELYGVLRSEIMEVVIPCSALLIPACLIVMCILPPPVALVFVMLLPAASLGMLILSFEDDSSYEPAHTLPEQAKGSFWREFITIGIGAVVVHATNAACWNLIPQTLFSRFDSWHAPAIIVGALLATAVSVAMLTYSKRPDICTVYRLFLPVLVIACACVTFQTDISYLIASICLMSTQIGYSIMFYVFFARVIHAGLCNAGIGLGVGRGFCQTGIAVGTICGQLLLRLVDSRTLSIGSACMLIATICVAFVLLLLNRNSIYYKTGITNQSHGGSHIENFHEAATQKTTPNRFDLESICERISLRYDLSPRESEVFSLLAHGYTLENIRDELFISKNTVNSHTKHIYKKMGIHSRQELLNLVYTYND